MSSSGSKGAFFTGAPMTTLVSVVGTQDATSLSNASAAGPGTVLTQDGVRARANHSMMVVASAGVTAGVVRLQGSLDGANWVNIDSAGITLTTSGVFSESVAGTPMGNIRANITTAITGGTVTVTIASA